MIYVFNSDDFVADLLQIFQEEVDIVAGEEEEEEEEEKENEEVSFILMFRLILETSIYELSFSKEKTQSPRDKLNEFLASRDISPIRHSLGTP